MSGLKLDVWLDNRSSSAALREIERLVEEYPLIKEELSSNLSEYIEANVYDSKDKGVVVMVEVSIRVYELIASLYEVEFMMEDITTVGDTRKRYIEVNNGKI